MGLVINTNTAASLASSSLSRSNSMLQKSLTRLSSGVKITNPADDAGGLAVSMKMTSAIKRTNAVKNNIANSTSFLQTQDGALKTIGKILDRMSELKTLYNDPTKSTSDQGNYQTEFGALQSQLGNLKAEAFNGVSIFAAAASTTISVAITENGSKSVDITRSHIIGGLTVNSTDLSDPANSLGVSGTSVNNIRNAIESVATMRATNGAEASQLQFAVEMLAVNKTNLEAANSRIVDTDIAEESTRFARYNILSQSGTAMLAQANSIPKIALQLLQG